MDHIYITYLMNWNIKNHRLTIFLSEDNPMVQVYVNHFKVLLLIKGLWVLHRNHRLTIFLINNTKDNYYQNYLLIRYKNMAMNQIFSSKEDVIIIKIYLINYPSTYISTTVFFIMIIITFVYNMAFDNII